VLNLENKTSPRYSFSEIPNNEEGHQLVALMRQYLNKDRYTLRVRGQHRDHSRLRTGERFSSYGQPINRSKCLRIYVDEKIR
jgi:hypothetical protein